ncbi:hypothetical protein BV25DRAFT_1912534 [Artomyces pyxidatus]|uniref:Uncharacterized protein n=1 Tax=Artomyces pyxidatus TaxID=48021 RepID=A0ACB8TDG4_9AGAM|nr:hypothetical protein BV25DRAFT_1912534 [Artomyces pyxidatus]
METRDSLSPSKLSRPRKSLFSRKTTKRNSTQDSTGPPPSLRSVDKSEDAEQPTDSLSRTQSRESVTSGVPRSIIPEVLKDLPAWYNKEGEWATASVHQFRARYPIHNPVGPRYYRNVHLMLNNASQRPSSVFSPAFPPMTADLVDEPAWAPGPSRTPSGSPLPTPESSQVRIPDALGKGRSRKASNAPHDNIDLLDVSDPYGTNWHHQSPYDGLGLNNERSPVSPEGADSRPVPRSRMSSLNGGSRHKTTTPSPLSQSTSAVHLQTFPSQDDSPTKQTKHRKPVPGFTAAGDGEPPAETASAPVTPVDAVTAAAPSVSTSTSKPPPVRRQMAPGLFKSASTTSIPISASIASVAPSEKKQKRGSVLVRIARRFSIMRRQTRGHSREPSVEAEDWHDVGHEKGGGRPPSTAPARAPSPEKAPAAPQQTADVDKGIPPPPPSEDEATPAESVHDSAPEAPAQPEPPSRRDSDVSLEAPFSIGRLTIANPDVPSSTDNSPIPPSMALPFEGAILGTTSSRGRDEKALPIPRFSLDERPAPLVESPTQVTPPAAPTFAHTSPPPASVASPPLEVEHTPAPRPPHAPSAPVTATPPSMPVPQVTPAPFIRPAHLNNVHPSSSVDDSPLSKASLLVNPPTPYLAPVQIAVQIPSPVITHIPSASTAHPAQSSTAPTPQQLTSPASQFPRQSSSREGSPTKEARESSPTKGRETSSRHVKSSSSVKRETETFRLVRSPSAGYVTPTGETIVAQGEFWEVVGADQTKRSKTTKEKEEAKEARRSRRESRREEKEKEKAEAAKAAEQAAFQAAAEAATRSEHRKSRSHPKDGSSSRKRSSRDSKDPHRRSTDDAASRPTSNGVAVAAPSHERRPSLTARPTSELTSAADMNAVRAREVWEMDRLFKGRSMAYGLDGPQVVYAQSIGDGSSTGDPRRSTSTVAYGSQHTSYKLQSGFHAPNGTHPYTQIPFPQPALYAGQAPAPSYVYPSGYRSYPDISTLPTISSPESSPPRRALTNPLPEPPRMSAYKPPPLPASLSDVDSQSGAEYWAKFAGVVTPTH